MNTEDPSLTPEEQLKETPGELTPADAAATVGAAPKKPKKVKFHGEDGTKLFRPGAAMRAAITEVAMRETAGFKPHYRETAERHNVKWTSLETLYRRYKKGMLDMSESIQPEKKKEIDLRAELERSLRLLGKYEKHLNDVFEDLLKKADKELKEGNLLAFDQLQIGKVVAQLQLTGSLRAKKEKGVLEILGQLLELQKRREAAERVAKEPKPLTGTIVEPPKGNQIHAAAAMQTGAIARIRDALTTKQTDETPQS